ncbi:MAG: site-specific integrase [Negativicutes bacterium]|nr:site-specific integrase [Negativicutes bacterium]
MARQVRDAVLGTREARRRLKTQSEPHWRALDNGLHLGYRKRATGGSWIGRRFTENKKYSKSKLGVADDFQDADGIKTLNFQQAQAAARKWFEAEIRIEAGLEEAQTGKYTVADAMRDYMVHYSVEGKGIAATQSSINAHILPALGKVEVAKLTSKKIADWHRDIAASSAMLRTGKAADKRNVRAHDSKDADVVRRRRATANRVMTILKAALNYAWKEGKTANDTAWRKISPFKNVDAPVVRYLTEEECRRLINASPNDLRAIVNGALFTGCRYSELARLIANDFNPDVGTVTVRLSKSGKVRHVILTDEGKKFFENAVLNKQGNDFIFLREGGAPWGNSHQKRPIIEACKNAKIKPAISFHVLRHTHGSLLAMKGVPMPVIAKQLGHADTRMTEKHYAHLSPSYVADTIRQNFPTLGTVEESNVEVLKCKK